MWTEVSSSVPHFLQMELLLSPITYKCLLSPTGSWVSTHFNKWLNWPSLSVPDTKTLCYNINTVRNAFQQNQSSADTKHNTLHTILPNTVHPTAFHIGIIRRNIINQLFTSAQHLLLLIIGLHVSTDHWVIFRSLICCKFQGAVHTFGIPIVFKLKLKPFLSVGG